MERMKQGRETGKGEGGERGWGREKAPVCASACLGRVGCNFTYGKASLRK